jgi:hypothetical protein
MRVEHRCAGLNVGRFDHDAVVPRDREQHAAVDGLGDQKRRVGAAERVDCDDDVRAAAVREQRPRRRIVERADAVHEDSGCVDHHACPNGELPVRLALERGHAGDTPLRISNERRRADVVREHGTVVDCGAC